MPLSDFVVTMLVDELQIGSYLLEEQCAAGVEPFILKTGNWNKGMDTEYYKNPKLLLSGQLRQVYCIVLFVIYS